jgi:hypothetical protein
MNEVVFQGMGLSGLWGILTEQINGKCGEIIYIFWGPSSLAKLVQITIIPI